MKNLLIIAIFAMLAISCTESKDNQPITQTTDSLDTMKEISLAKVNNRSITAEDLREEFNMLNPQAQQMFMMEGGFEDLLNELIKKEMLYQEALKKDYPTRDEFKEIMDDYKKRVMISFLLREEVDERSKVSDEEVRKYYDDNKKEFALEKPEEGAPDFVDFDSVKKLIREHLESQKQAEVFTSYVSKLESAYKVEIDKDSFNSTFGNIKTLGSEESVTLEEPVAEEAEVKKEE